MTSPDREATHHLHLTAVIDTSRHDYQHAAFWRIRAELAEIRIIQTHASVAFFLLNNLAKFPRQLSHFVTLLPTNQLQTTSIRRRLRHRAGIQRTILQCFYYVSLLFCFVFGLS
jgi:hypothetical protein